jgi:hypothetical protein
VREEAGMQEMTVKNEQMLGKKGSSSRYLNAI